MGEDAFQRIIKEKHDANIMFLIQQANIRSSELKTAKEFNKEVANVNEAANKKISNIEVSAYASPDGGVSLNTTLAENREDNTTKMFQFPALAPEMIRWRVFNTPGCPIRKSPDQRLFAPPRSLSQLITSFIASESQGIRHAPFFTFLIHSPTLACQRDDIYFQLFTTKITVCLYNMS